MSSTDATVKPAEAVTPRPAPSAPSAAAILRGNAGKGIRVNPRVAWIGTGVLVFLGGVFFAVNVVAPFFMSASPQATMPPKEVAYNVRDAGSSSTSGSAGYHVVKPRVMQSTTRVVTTPTLPPNVGAPQQRQGNNPWNYTTPPTTSFNVPGVPTGMLANKMARLEVTNADSQQSGASQASYTTTDAGSSSQSAADAAALAATQGGGGNHYDSQSTQTQGQGGSQTGIPGQQSSVYLNESVQQPRQPCVLNQGAILPAIFMGAMDSHYPGDPMALMNRNVYSSDQQCLMFPKNARLRLKYVNLSDNGTTRLFVIATRCIFPNGSWIALNKFDALSQDGSEGVNSYGRSNGWGVIGQTLLLSGFQAVFNKVSNSNSVSQISINSSSGGGGGGPSGLNDLIQQIVKQGTSAQPDLKIDIGTQMNIDVALDIELTGPYEPKSL